MSEVRAAGSVLSQLTQLATRAQDRDATGRPDSDADVDAGSGTADRVNFTATATRLSNVKSGLGNVPVVDTNRVEAVRGAVESGTYRVDSRRVADKLMSFERMLGREPSPDDT